MQIDGLGAASWCSWASWSLLLRFGASGPGRPCRRSEGAPGAAPQWPPPRTPPRAPQGATPTATRACVLQIYSRGRRGVAAAGRALAYPTPSRAVYKARPRRPLSRPPALPTTPHALLPAARRTWLWTRVSRQPPASNVPPPHPPTPEVLLYTASHPLRQHGLGVRPPPTTAAHRALTASLSDLLVRRVSSRAPALGPDL